MELDGEIYQNLNPFQLVVANWITVRNIKSKYDLISWWNRQNVQIIGHKDFFFTFLFLCCFFCIDMFDLKILCWSGKNEARNLCNCETINIRYGLWCWIFVTVFDMLFFSQNFFINGLKGPPQNNYKFIEIEICSFCLEFSVEKCENNLMKIILFSGVRVGVFFLGNWVAN